jgi:hypothetical protein
VRAVLGVIAFAVAVGLMLDPAFGQQGPKLLDIDGFITKGAFTELDRGFVTHRLSLREVEESHFNGKSTDIKDVLGLMARYQKLRPRVDEPGEVRGEIPVFLPPNTLGDEAYTACFYAFTFNGLVLAGTGDELVLVRPETRRNLSRPERRWNRDQVLSTGLSRLGYLKPDPVMKHYRDKLGTAAGRAVLERRSNVLLVTDRAEVLGGLGNYIDSEILLAAGVPASESVAPGEGLRPPSLGAIASREAIHFYLMAFARRNRIPLAASEEKGVLARHYPEADLWTNERGYSALEQEFKRLNEFVRIARQTAGQEWDEPYPGRTLWPAQQKRLSIRFGVVSSSAAKRTVTKSKKAARKRS